METIISVLTIIFVFLIMIEHAQFYNLTCPSDVNWKFRAQAKCNRTSTYFCLYNNVKEIYVEGCNGPDWDRKGSKRIFSGSFTRGNCSHNRYQPWLFWTNGSSNCFYVKSKCSEEGQLVSNVDSTIDDRACRCDYTRNYSFITTPRTRCYCKPTEEDCSCYIKQCLVNDILSADYECIERGYHGKTTCKEINKHREELESIEQVTFEVVPFWPSETPLKTNRKISSVAIMLIIMIIVCAVTIAVLYIKLTTDERCRVCQKGKTVSSKDFDIRLMLLLLSSLSYYKISDVYEDKSDENTNAFFSRIKYMRNEITRRFAGKLSKSLFEQYWDDISKFKKKLQETEHGQAETQQIDCLGVRCVQQTKDFELPVPTIEENYFLVVFHVIAGIVYPVLQHAYNTSTPLEKIKTEQHQTHCSDEESKNLYIRMMLDTLIKSAEKNGESDRIFHLEVIKGIQREIVQSCSGVLTKTRFHKILESMREAVLYLGGTFPEEKLLELQKIKNILE